MSTDVLQLVMSPRYGTLHTHLGTFQKTHLPQRDMQPTNHGSRCFAADFLLIMDFPYPYLAAEDVQRKTNPLIQTGRVKTYLLLLVWRRSTPWHDDGGKEDVISIVTSDSFSLSVLSDYVNRM